MIPAQIDFVNASYFKLSACGRKHGCCNIAHLTIVKVQSWYCIITFRSLRFLFNSNDMMLLVELNNSKRSCVGNGIPKYHSTALSLNLTSCLKKMLGKRLPMKHVIAKNERTRLSIDELPTDGKSLGKSGGFFLNSIFNTHTKSQAIAKQLFESRCISKS